MFGRFACLSKTFDWKIWSCKLKTRHRLLMEHFIIFCCLPLKDLWTKGQFNLTSANFMAAKKAVTALWGKKKKNKTTNKKTTTKQNQEQESTSENRSGPHVVFSSTDTHTHTSCLGYISFKNSLWKKIQAIGATSAFSKVDWNTELSLYLRVWFEVPTCIKLILLLWALNGISANSPGYLTEMSREM